MPAYSCRFLYGRSSSRSTYGRPLMYTFGSSRMLCHTARTWRTHRRAQGRLLQLHTDTGYGDPSAAEHPLIHILDKQCSHSVGMSNRLSCPSTLQDDALSPGQ